jgi:hypothetical protein
MEESGSCWSGREGRRMSLYLVCMSQLLAQQAVLGLKLADEPQGWVVVALWPLENGPSLGQREGVCVSESE